MVNPRALGPIAILGLVALMGGCSRQGDIRELKLKDWEPRPMLTVKQTHLERARFPVIDIYNKLRPDADREAFLREMDAAGVFAAVNLEGGFTMEETLAQLERWDNAHPGRFVTFAQVDFDNCDEPGWAERQVELLERRFEAGAKGLEISKSLGLGHTYSDGTLVRPGDPRLDPIWQVCARHGRPVMIHVGDPKAFFTPLDRFNERWHELRERPYWMFYGEKWPSWEELIEGFTAILERNPDTLFIGAHMGNTPEDLGTLARWMEAYPNLVVATGPRISELGRQPYTARRFIMKYQDRVMFGSDTRPRRDAYQVYYRFFETDDEYFDPADSHHLQGFWMIYGIHLPEEVLEKIYHKNALRLLPGMAEHEERVRSFGR